MTRIECDNCGAPMEHSRATLRRSSPSGIYELELSGRDVSRGHSDRTDLCEGCLLSLWAGSEPDRP